MRNLLLYLSRIEQFSTLINLLNKVWVPQGADHHEIDFAPEEALKRIEDKTFGTCTECEKSIPKQRLTAMPWAGLCLECQAKEDPQKKII